MGALQRTMYEAPQEKGIGRTDGRALGGALGRGRGNDEVKGAGAAGRGGGRGWRGGEERLG